MTLSEIEITGVIPDRWIPAVEGFLSAAAAHPWGGSALEHLIVTSDPVGAMLSSLPQPEATELATALELPIVVKLALGQK